MNTELCIEYWLRDKEQLAEWLSWGPQKPWVLLADGGIQWDEAVIGMPCPTLEQLAAIEPDALARQQAQKFPAYIVNLMYIYRNLLRKHFGPNAETNREVTEDAVNTYFLTATGLSGDDVRDGAYIKDLFEKLAPLSGDGTTWTLPWEIVP